MFTPAAQLIELTCDNDVEVREGAMCNPNIPREVVKEYYQQHLISNHPNSQSHELSKLISSKWWFIRVNAAKHPNLSLNDLEPFLCDSNLNVRASAVSNKNISIELLEKLASDKSTLVRSSVAKNLKTPIQCLEKLSRDRNEEVRAFVAFNPNISVELSAFIKAELNSGLLKKYSKTKLFNQEQYNAAVNAATSLTELIAIYKKTQNDNGEAHYEAMKNICQQLMCNQDVSAELILELLTKLFSLIENINICTVIAHHQNANNEICKRLIGYTNLKLRCSVAQNQKSSRSILEILVKDANRVVRAAAKERLMNFAPLNPP